MATDSNPNTPRDTAATPVINWSGSSGGEAHNYQMYSDGSERVDGQVQTPPAPQPSEVAAKSNYWTLSIVDLDGIIDRLEARIKTLVESHGTARERGQELREAATVIRGVRDRLLAENYDANRHGKGVTER